MVQLVCAVFLLLAAVSCEARLRSAWLPEADYEQKHERDEDTPKDLALVEEGAKVKLGLGDDDEYDWYTAPPGYDKHIRPAPADNSATEVWVNLDIRQLYKISAIDSTAELEVRLELSWTDERLKYAPTKTENKQRPKTIPAPKTWVPKMTFANQVEEPLVSAKLMQVDPDGRIRYRRRMKVRERACGSGVEWFVGDAEMRRCGDTAAAVGKRIMLVPRSAPFFLSLLFSLQTPARS